jgi:hypothetical protein
MTEYRRRSTWAFVLAASLLAIAAGMVAYNMGLSHGAATAAALQAAPGPYAYPSPYAWGWHRPWGFGFFPIFPIFFFLALFFLFRGACWGGPWRHRWYYDERDRTKEGTPADDPRRG